MNAGALKTWLARIDEIAQGLSMDDAADRLQFRVDISKATRPLSWYDLRDIAHNLGAGPVPRSRYRAEVAIVDAWIKRRNDERFRRSLVP